MLERLRVKNFRLLRDVDISFELGLPTVFIGPNAAGKSTVLEIIDFLMRCGKDGLVAASEAHGGMHSLRTAATTDPIEIESTWSFGLTERGKKRGLRLIWRLALQAAQNGAPIVLEETLVDELTGVKSVTTGDEHSRYVHSENDASEPSPIETRTKLAFESYVDRKRYGNLSHLRNVVSQSSIVGALFTAPKWARGESSLPSPRDTVVIGPQSELGRQGVGLANVLYHIFTEHAEAWGELERAIRGEFPFVRRIIFPPDAGGSKISFAFEDIRFAGRKFYSSEMSDGMIAYLCLLAAVLNPMQGGILGLDEPDANLHPSALRRLMSLTQRPHPGRRLAIVTHSNALLDELRDPARSIRIVESTPQGAVIRKLDADALTAWRKDYTISEMRRTGLLDPPNRTDGNDA